jgi:hypothetical protein
MAGQGVTENSDLIVAPSVALATYAFMYVFVTAISVLKPWGLTKRGRRRRSAARTTVDAKVLRPTA